MQGSTSLRKLNLEGAKLGDEGAVLLSNALASHMHTNLIQLELSGCDIGAAGMRRLFEVLQGFCAPALEVQMTSLQYRLKLMPCPMGQEHCSLNGHSRNGLYA